MKVSFEIWEETEHIIKNLDEDAARMSVKYQRKISRTEIFNLMLLNYYQNEFWSVLGIEFAKKVRINICPSNDENWYNVYAGNELMFQIDSVTFNELKEAELLHIIEKSDKEDLIEGDA